MERFDGRVALSPAYHAAKGAVRLLTKTTGGVPERPGRVSGATAPRDSSAASSACSSAIAALRADRGGFDLHLPAAVRLSAASVSRRQHSSNDAARSLSVRSYTGQRRAPTLARASRTRVPRPPSISAERESDAASSGVSQVTSSAS